MFGEMTMLLGLVARKMLKNINMGAKLMYFFFLWFILSVWLVVGIIHLVLWLLLKLCQFIDYVNAKKREKEETMQDMESEPETQEE